VKKMIIRSAVIFIIFMLTGMVQANTINVPDDYTTIQEAINMAQECDTVLVAYGTYTGEGNRDIDFNGKALVLKSEWDTGLPIIECDSVGHRGFNFRSGEGSNSVLDGFIIQGGYIGGDGGAILCDGVSPTIKNCRLRNNSALGGGGIACMNGAAPSISFCSFERNGSWGDGGGLYCSNSSPPVTNCTFIANQTTWLTTGGAIYCGENSTPIFNNCIIAFNLVGGAVTCENENSIPTFNCTNIFNNYESNWDSLIADQNGINGNIESDPLFCNFIQDIFNLSPESPCLPENNECATLIGALGLIEEFICGDFNQDDIINILDVTAAISYLYMGGMPPINDFVADVNGSGDVNILDVTYYINYLYKGGPAPDCLAASSSYGGITMNSGCGGYPEEKGTAIDDSLDCFEYTYDGESILQIVHHNAGLNCCPWILSEITIDGDQIVIEEIDSLFMGGCHCWCLFDINYYINGITPGTYTISFIEPYKPGGDENLEVTVDLIAEPSGMYCVPRSDYPWGY